ncbi:putative ribonuclease H-like domain-containing protein [Tanacetum coccineum]|uniref:Ribonuclease H-like domain-containing protein n=1 Tax=Tanacetum coccineum TaxID=301880 RepID=A0ABQ5C4P8_9ASTR
MNVCPIPTTRIHTDYPNDQIIRDINLATQTRRMTKISKELAMVRYIKKQRRTNHKDYQNCLVACFLSQIEPKKVTQALTDPSWIEAMQDELLQFSLQKDRSNHIIFCLCIIYGFIVYQMDVKSAFLYATIEEEVYVCQPPGFEDPQFLDKVYKVMQRDDGIFISQDKYVADILKKFDFSLVKTASTPIETNKTLFKDEEAEDVDVHLYRSMIGSLMYLTASRPDIMFDVCACARFHITPKTSHLHAVNRICRYLKGQPKLCLLCPRDSPFDLEAFSDNDYARASLDRKSTTRGCQFLGKRLISWQCKKQSIVANSTTEEENVAAANCCGQTVVISESSVRSDIHFNDEDGITCLTNTAIFENLVLMGSKSTSWNEFSTNIASPVICLATGQKFNFSKLIIDGRVTPLFASMLAPPVVRGEGSGQPSESQPPSSTTQPIIEEQIPTSIPIPNVADEVVFKERDDRVVRATTIAASLDVAQASGNITKTQSTRAFKHSYDSPLPGVNTLESDEERNEQHDLTDFLPPTPHDSPLLGGHTPGSDEGRPNINKLMAICTNLSNRVLGLEQSKTAQDLVINNLQKKVKRLEKALRERTSGMKLFKIGTPKRKGLDKGNVSKQGRKSDKTKPMFKDSEFDVLDDAMENVKGGSTVE